MLRSLFGGRAQRETGGDQQMDRSAAPLQASQASRGERRAYWWEALITNTADVGLSVTPDNAMTLTAVYACVRILAETVASLPLLVYERLERGKRRADDFYLYDILHSAPNPLLTSFEMREALQAHLALWGNAYTEIEYNGAGQITALWPLRPDRMLSIKTNGTRRTYEYQLPDGQTKYLDESRVWHIRGLGSDGTYGYSPIALMKNAVGLGLATEKFGAKFFGNGARPGGVLEHPGVLGIDAARSLRESWNEMHMGLDNAQRVAILEEGMKYHQIGVPPEEAQFLQTRRFQLNEIARMYRIPPHMIGDMDRATFNNIEHQGIEFVVHTATPWLVRWEQSISRDLMTERERERYFAEFLVDGLLRGDTPSRYQAYATGFQNGWLSQNDIRERENMNPIEDGDEYYVPLNLVSTSESLKVEGSEESKGEEEQARNARIGRIERNIENRAMAKGARSRRRNFEAIQGVFEDAARRIYRREKNDVGEQARKTLKPGYGAAEVAEFERWLAAFYDGHETFARKQMAPSMESYARQTLAAVEDELEELRLEAIGAGLAEPGEATYDDIRGFVESYIAQYGARTATRSLSWLQQALHEAAPGDELAAIEGKLDEWQDWRAANTASEEATRESNAVARTAYRVAGILKIRSMAFGESCPFCRGLDGVVIDIEKFFLEAGVPFQPEGAASPLTVSSSKSHAPYHDGCDCMTFASL
jgi:HK97 family phage portal protein